jgi:aryl-alcohol dehydrogenase-like predicted oxidoreductase
MKPIQGEVFTTVNNTNDIVRVMEVKEAVRRIREHNSILQSAEPRNSPIITEILESCARLLEDIDAGKVRYVGCGRWERRTSNIYACSECTNEVTYQQSQNYSFCPYCGALMDGDKND